MLKITSIVSSIFFLLFAVSGTYARTLSKSSQQHETSRKHKQEKNEETDKDGKPVESAVQLDVFKAISLVNSQLRWKDFHAENYRNSRLLFSSKKGKAEVRESNNSQELFDAQFTATLPVIENNWILSSYAANVKITATIQRSLAIQENTIAFILNCGTYPPHIS